MNIDPIEQAVKGLLAEVAVSVSVSDWHKVKELAEAVVKLQPKNETALKFISLASEHIGVKPELANKPISPSEPIIKQVQKALNAYDQAKAEALVQAYLADNPTDSDGLKAQNIVLEHRQRDRRRRSDQRLGFNTRAGTQVSTQPSSQKSDDEKKKTISGIIFLGIIVLILFGICSIQDGGDEITASCEKAWREAASIGDMSDTVEDLDPAVIACRSLDEWNAAAAKYPAALDGVDSVLYLSNRCYHGPKSATLCRWLIANPSFIHPHSSWGIELKYGNLFR